ncbi:MAG: hypothetical protein LBU99_06725, partial [Spirochaetaceae bacterium]|nr:hypothetical protein [Spirochaetaceae bacterium]
GIETQSADEVIEKLSDLLKTYESDARLAQYLTNLIRDYFVCFISEGDFSQLVLRHNIENYYPCLFFGKKNIPNPLAFYGKISSYNIAGSVFYTDVHAELLNQCFAECLERIGLFLGERSIDFRELGIHDIRNSSDWKPFKDAVCGMPIVQGKKSVEISEFEEYYRVHYAWICGAYAELEQGISQLIGYILKRMESIMRNIVHFKGKLNADAAPMALKIRNYSKKQTAIVNLMRDPSFTELIDETVAYWFQKHHPEVFTDPKSIYKKPITIEVDFGKLDQIRSDAAEIQGKLILYDDLPEEEVQPKASSHAPIIHDEIETAGGLEGFVSRLSPEEREMVAIILDKQQQRLAQFALDKQLLIEVLLEHINEIALECIGDTVIDTGSDPVFIYDEYEKELSYMLSTIY